MKIRIAAGRVFGDDYFVSLALPDGRVVVISLFGNGIVVYDGGKAYKAELKPMGPSDIEFYLPLEGQFTINGHPVRRVVEGEKMFLIVGERRYEVGKVAELEI